MSVDEQVLFKDYPLALWLSGVMFLVAGVFASDTVWEGILISLVGVAFIASASTLTVTVDRGRETLNLRYRSPVRTSTKAFRFDDISLVNVAEDDERERMYRLELILCSGEIVPLRKMYAIGKARKERRAKRIRSAIERKTFETLE